MLSNEAAYHSDRLGSARSSKTRIRKIERLSAVLFVLIAIAPLYAYGQDPFSQIDIAVGGAHNLRQDGIFESRIHEYWESGYGGEVSITTPFYLGDLDAGVSVHRYEPLSSRVPRFDALLVHLGWGFNWELVPGLFWYNGFRLGNSRMTFDADTVPGIRNESELLLAAHTRATVHLFRNTGVYASAHLAQTYTFIRFRTLYVSAGLVTSFRTPGWLQTFLR